MGELYASSEECHINISSDDGFASFFVAEFVFFGRIKCNGSTCRQGKQNVDLRRPHVSLTSVAIFLKTVAASPLIIMAALDCCVGFVQGCAWSQPEILVVISPHSASALFRSTDNAIFPVVRPVA